MIEAIAEIFPGWFEFILASSVFFLAELLYVAVGFGAGLLCVGILALFMPVIQDVVVLLLLVNLPVEMAIVWSSRKVLRWQGLLLILGGIVVGILLGAWILTFGTPVILLGILGLFLVVSGSGFALLPRMKPRNIAGWWEPAIGVIAGILAGLFGTGGPPVIYFYQLKGTKKAIFRGNLMAIFLFMGLVRIPTYTLTGLITIPRLWAALALFPVVMFGALLGQKVHLKMEEITFRRVVGTALAVIGVILIFRLLS